MQKKERYSVLCTNGYYAPEEVYTTESFAEAKSIAQRYNEHFPNCAYIHNNATGVLMDANGNLCED